MSEAFKCFTTIVDSTPASIDILESLQKKVKERQEHVSRVPVPARKLKKTGSNESIRPHSSGLDACYEVNSAPQDIDTAHPNDPLRILVNSRKRKTTSILSNDSIPSKYRSRSMIVVYYDSEIQNAFETTVRHIGTARNSIRRARMAARMEAMSTGDTASLLAGGPRTGYAPLAMFRSARGLQPRPDPDTDRDSTVKDAFCSVDAALEKAQSLCEKGAHQFLREGDCAAEILGAKDSFEEARRLAEAEMVMLKEQEEKRKKDIQERTEGLLDTTETEPLSGPIEVDDDLGDSDFDDAELQLPAFRSTRMMARG